MDEIGRRLRAAREARGISIASAEEETKIRRKYLEALEAGREADLPGEVYLKGFLRTYANFLGLDGPAIVEEFKDRKQGSDTRAESSSAHGAAQSVRETSPKPGPAPRQTHATKPAQAVRAAAVKAATAAERDAAPAAAGSKTVRRPVQGGWIYSRQAGWVVAGLLVIGLVAYGGVLGFRRLQKPEPTPTPAAVTTPASKPPDPAPPAPAAQPEPVKVTMSTPQGLDVNFTVPASQADVKVLIGDTRVWIRPTVDGKVLEDKIYEVHQTVEFKGAKILLEMGHMQGVDLNVNGQTFSNVLTFDKSWRLNFTAKP